MWRYLTYTLPQLKKKGKDEEGPGRVKERRGKEIRAHKVQQTYNLPSEYNFIFQCPLLRPPHLHAAPDLWRSLTNWLLLWSQKVPSKKGRFAGPKVWWEVSGWKKELPFYEVNPLRLKASSKLQRAGHSPRRNTSLWPSRSYPQGRQRQAKQEPRQVKTKITTNRLAKASYCVCTTLCFTLSTSG